MAAVAVVAASTRAVLVVAVLVRLMCKQSI
jgi:hypothetical protein